MSAFLHVLIALVKFLLHCTSKLSAPRTSGSSGTGLWLIWESKAQYGVWFHWNTYSVSPKWYSSQWILHSLIYRLDNSLLPAIAFEIRICRICLEKRYIIFVYSNLLCIWMHTKNVNRMIWRANDGILVTESIMSKFDKAAKRFCRYGLTFSPMAWLVHRPPAGNDFHRAAAFIAVGPHHQLTRSFLFLSASRDATK